MKGKAPRAWTLLCGEGHLHKQVVAAIGAAYHMQLVCLSHGCWLVLLCIVGQG